LCGRGAATSHYLPRLVLLGIVHLSRRGSQTEIDNERPPAAVP
jgi:hypothetical protein